LQFSSVHFGRFADHFNADGLTAERERTIIVMTRAHRLCTAAAAAVGTIAAAYSEWRNRALVPCEFAATAAATAHVLELLVTTLLPCDRRLYQLDWI